MAVSDDEYCLACELDERDVKEWRKNGGEMPQKRCTEDHRPKCKSCGNPTEPRKSGVCDQCWGELLSKEREERKARRREKANATKTQTSRATSRKAHYDTN